MKKQVEKTITLDLEGTNANAFAIMGAFKRQAEREGWSQDEINIVFKQAKSDDYDHLVSTLQLYCKAENDNEIDFHHGH